MANQNQGGGQNSGGNQGGQNQQKKQPSWPKCPVCGTRSLPKEREACPVCQPVYSVSADLTRGIKGWQIVVQTYENGVQVKVSFAVDISGMNVAIVKTDSKKYWKENGVAVIPLDFSNKKREASFHIIGGPADIRKLEIPAEKPNSFKSVKPDKNQGFLDNLLKGLRG